MKLMAASVMTAALALAGQWLNTPTPGVPRTADGKPDLAAAAPKAADGHPDLSGVWENPGWREGATGKFYLAYLRDPSGNKICALHRG